MKKWNIKVTTHNGSIDLYDGFKTLGKAQKELAMIKDSVMNGYGQGTPLEESPFMLKLKYGNGWIKYDIVTF